MTDLCVMEPDPETLEFIVTSIHPGVTRNDIEENTGWTVRYSAEVGETPVPTQTELDALRELKARTERAHRVPGKGEAAE